MIENRYTKYCAYLTPRVPAKIREPVYVCHDNRRIVRLDISRGPSECGYDVSLAETVTLRAGYAVLAATKEVVEMPQHLCAKVEGKSTWARLGVSLNTTKVDPGFTGQVTLEITYNPRWSGWWKHLRGLLRPRTLHIPAGVGIGTLVFHTLATTADYRMAGGKYKGAGVEEAR